MRRAVLVFGWITLVLASVLILLGVASWPPGGLMFALPYFFLIPGVILAIIGGLLLRAGRRPSRAERIRPEGRSTVP
jgi:hypothetical protein